LIGGSIPQAIFTLITAFIGMVGISTGMEGYMNTQLKLYERAICFFGGIMLIIPGAVTDVVGIVLVLTMFALQTIKVRKTVRS
jgi:TRAP-type uncharacterized transport system, fused permease components